MSLIQKISTGGGRIVLTKNGSNVMFSELSSTYPLKLLSPRLTDSDVAVVYLLNYGGGLVSGDCLKLTVDIGSGSSLVLLSQGSTKVFKSRVGKRLSSIQTEGHSQHTPNHTTQHMDFSISSQGALFLLPDPVTCFRAAAYSQIQTFHLSGDASVVILDWITSGRKSMGEEWDFARYYSVNEVWVDKKRVARDVMLLEEEMTNMAPLPRRTLRDRLAPYSCFATLLLFGPLVQNSIRNLSAQYETITVFKRAAPEDLVWSMSPVQTDGNPGAVVRVAAREHEGVKNWLSQALVPLQGIIGLDVYQRSFA